MSIAYAPTVLADSPVAYWRLGEAVGASSAVDASGNGRDGAVTGGVTFGQAGAVSDDTTAAQFDGVNGVITVADNAAFGTGVLSVEAWMFGAPPATGSLANRRTAGNVGGWTLEGGGGKGNWWCYINGSFRNCSSTNAIAAGAWHHLVATYDGANMRLYVDGVEAATPMAIVGAVNNPVAPTLLIGRNVVSGGYWNTKLDDVALYATALSAVQVAAHYAAAQPFKAALARGCNQSIGYVAPPGAMNA